MQFLDSFKVSILRLKFHSFDYFLNDKYFFTRYSVEFSFIYGYGHVYNVMFANANTWRSERNIMSVHGQFLFWTTDSKVPSEFRDAQRERERKRTRIPRKPIPDPSKLLTRAPRDWEYNKHRYQPRFPTPSLSPILMILKNFNDRRLVLQATVCILRICPRKCT